MKRNFQESCPHCPKRFQYRCYLQRHIRSHVETKKYSCMHCGQKYDSEKLYLEHEAFCENALKEETQAVSLDSSNDGGLKCSFCTKSFTKARSLRSHILTHTDVKPYRCKACEKSFSRFDHLKRHQTSCKGKKQQLELFSQSNLTRHMALLHSTESPFICKHCGKEYSSLGTLRRHSRTVKCKRSSGESLKAPASNGFTCVGCSERFLLFSQLQQHLLTKHRSQGLQKSENPENQQSDMKANPVEEGTVKSLRSSSQVCEKTKPYECPTCSKKFINTSGLAMHVRTHTARYPFSCGRCSKGFWCKLFLQKHKRKCKSPEVLPDKDPDLENEATSESELNDSVLVIKKGCKSTGTGVLQTKFSCKDNEKDDVVHKYQCSECDQSFTDGLRLIKHMLTHRDENFPCDLCDKTFSCKSSRAEHRKS
uniref:C2H2-type domain-containing protein n=1 Tax=Astyanax mexicanus TaxID=7994 RepID=A0A8B9JT93_ASTMX